MKKLVIPVILLSLLCGGSAWASTVTVQLQDIDSGTTSPTGTYRWLDVADNLYQTSYQSSFTYTPPHTVSLTYNDTSSTFAGSLVATGLKPNFAYQMKLVGSSAVDAWTNEKIGYSGRWWCVRFSGSTIIAQGNTDDSFYEDHKDDPNYIFQGYLLFDFFVTNQSGNASVTFAADSSYHVLYATMDSTTTDLTGHRAPVAAGVVDSAVRYYDFTASPSTNSDAYGMDYGAAHVGIYAEWEPGRPYTNELVLPMGDYSCQFILTEESFHQSGLGGNWAGAMGADVNFTVVPIPPTALLLGAGLVALIGVRRKRQ